MAVPFAHGFFEHQAIVEGAKAARDEGYTMSNLARIRLGLPLTGPLYQYRPFIAHYWLVTVTFLLAIVIATLLIAKA